jgi:hypothetical protein
MWALAIDGASLTAAAEDPTSGPEDIRADVWTIIESKCLRCHNARRKQGRLDMSTRAAMLAGGDSGPALVVGKAEKSLLIDLIDFDEMPPRKEKPRVTKSELEILRAWIDAGAPGREPRDKTRDAP